MAAQTVHQRRRLALRNRSVATVGIITTFDMINDDTQRNGQL